MNAQWNQPEEPRYISLPHTFFRDFVPTISSLGELKSVLYAIYLIHEKGDGFSAITFEELFDNPMVQDMLHGEARLTEDTILAALEKAVRTGILLYLPLKISGKQEDVYLINNTGSKEALARIRKGAQNPAEILQNNVSWATNEEETNIFTLYEENIGMLTPMIVEQLKEAQQVYPYSWIKDAFREAASLNKRSWRYIEKILQRWGLEGREHGPSGRHTKENDPDKYIKGKYGHIVRR